LLFLTSCTGQSPVRKGPPLLFNDNYDDPEIQRQAEVLSNKLTTAEKEQLLQNYIYFYRYATSAKCRSSVEARPLTGITRLNIPTIDIKTEKKDSYLASPIDVSSDVEGQKIGSLREEVDQFEKRMTPNERVRQKSLDAADGLLVRTGEPGKVRYLLCNRQKDKSVLSTEDKLIKKMVDIENYEAFCSWLADKKRGFSVSEEQAVTELLQSLMRVRLI